MVQPEMNVPTDGNWGVDTIGVRFDLPGLQRKLPGFPLRVPQPNGYRLTLKNQRGGIAVEFSPSRLVDPTDWRPASVETLHQSLRFVVDLAAGTVGLQLPDDAWKITRLDITRDFVACGQMPWIKRPARTYLASFLASDGVRTGYKGRSERKHRGRQFGLYDKFREKGRRSQYNEVPEGTVRFETVLNGRWARKYGLGTLAELTETNLWAGLESSWEWSGCGQPWPADEGLARLLNEPKHVAPQLRSILDVLSDLGVTGLPSAERLARRLRARANEDLVFLDLQKGTIEEHQIPRRVCKVKGCSEPVHAMGRCNTHYRKRRLRPRKWVSKTDR